jgi:hypothetical protein
MRGGYMHAVTILASAVIPAAVTWRLAIRRATATIAALRAETTREIHYWHARAERERTRAIQLERELASWSDGCRQGREDVVSIMPMLLAAQNQQAQLRETGAGSST